MHEVFSGDRYLFTCSPDEDPFRAINGIWRPRVIEVHNGQRRELTGRQQTDQGDEEEEYEAIQAA